MCRKHWTPLAMTLCVGLATFGCSKDQQAPTGLAVGLGLGAEARAVQQYDGYPVEAPPETKSTSKPDVHGTLSVENFQGTQNNLSYTHESANGFRNYLANWDAPNFNYRDGTVGTWQFHDIAGGDNWDKWTSGTVDYGIDAVLTAFHSSHGGMNASGVYSTSLGQNWYGRGWSASSNKMTLGANAGGFGNERLRYMFWDTCQALRERGGKNTAQLWRPSARGIRMIFGYRDNSVDSSHYGQYFWQEWNKNKTFKQAFLDASWRISHGQSPCVLAFGATQTEAINRRNGERMLYWGAVQSSWGAWSWYNAKSLGGKSAVTATSVPYEVRLQDVKSRTNNNRTVVDIAADLGISVADERMIQRRPFGMTAVLTDKATLVIEPDGDFELLFQQAAEGEPAKGAAMDDAAYESRARQIVDQFDLAKGERYEVAQIRYTMDQADDEATGATEAKATETTVIFAQVANDLQFIDPDAGQLELTFDNAAQKIVRVRSSWRALTPEYEKAARVHQPRSLDDLRMLAKRQFQEPPQPDASGRATEEKQLEIVPDSEEIGYYDIEGVAVPVYRSLLQDPRYPDSKYHEAIVPLAAS